jgi:hypothetical protein
MQAVHRAMYGKLHIRKKCTETIYILCPFAVYYLRYGVRPRFTISRNSFADGKRAGQKVQCKIAVTVQKVKYSVLFIPLF